MTLLGDAFRCQRFSKTRDRALTLAAQRLSYARAWRGAGCVKSVIGVAVADALTEPQLPSGGVPELAGLWTRTRTRAGRLMRYNRGAPSNSTGGTTMRVSAPPKPEPRPDDRSRPGSDPKPRRS